MSQAVQDTPPVVQTIDVNASPERVFALWTEPDGLVQWWPEAATFEPRVGGQLLLQFPQGDVTGEVTRFEPPNALGFTWIRSDFPDYTTTVDVSITDLGDGRSRVELVHSGWEALPEEYVAEWKSMHSLGWQHFLSVLDDLVAGRPVDKTFGAMEESG
jgi:uncharacterized protein YndB with AHSA1/START domain